MRSKLFLPLAAVVAATTLTALSYGAASSAPRRYHKDYGSVTAESRYGNPSRTVPVRRGQFGPEIDLGHNTWIHCAAGDCRETLRREKIDFWETKREEGSGGGRQ